MSHHAAIALLVVVGYLLFVLVLWLLGVGVED